MADSFAAPSHTFAGGFEIASDRLLPHSQLACCIGIKVSGDGQGDWRCDSHDPPSRQGICLFLLKNPCGKNSSFQSQWGWKHVRNDPRIERISGKKIVQAAGLGRCNGLISTTNNEAIANFPARNQAARRSYRW
jgi:hypothetical protein